MATIAEQKSALEKWTPLYLFDVVLKDGVPRYWSTQVVTFAGNPYISIVLDHSEFKQEGNGVFGIDAVTQIGLTLNNADANLNAILVPGVFQGGVIQPRFIFVSPDGTTTTDAIVYPKFLCDLPTKTWPRVEFSAHNKWNLGRKMLPASQVTRKDRYPFPDTAEERAAAGYDPQSEFYASGYDPDTGKGNMKPGGGYYTRADYDGTREKLREIGLEVRFGGFGKVPPTVVGTPKKGERADYVGNANEAKYGQAVPLVFGTCRIQPIVLDTGFPSGVGGWNGARLSHYLLSDGVNFGPEATMGIEDVLNVFIPDNAKYQKIPETSNEPQTTGAWSFQGGYYGSQKAPASSKYRNIDQSLDFPDPVGEFTNRDLYSGLAYLEIGFPKELSGEDGIGPKLEAIVKGLKLETWDSGANGTWQWTDNPVWIFVHLLKLLRWTTAEMDLTSIYNAASFCDEIVPSGKKRFRCNLALTSQTRANDVLRGIRNNCRMYTTFAQDGRLQLRIARDVAGEGGLQFTLDSTTIMRGRDGELLVEKFHRSVFELANVFSSTFQNEDNFYNSDSFTKIDIRNVNQIDERVSADSIFPILGLPSFDQTERQLEWARQEQITLNEYYRVTCSMSLIQAQVGQIGTITEPRHALINQQVRIRAITPGIEEGTIELVLQKHSDGAYTDNSVETPFTRAQADSSYTPRSVAGQTAATPSPRLTELVVADPVNADLSVRRIRVEFKPPARDFEGIFSRATKIRDVSVLTSGGSVPGGQVLFVEISPVKGGLRGLASEYLMVVVPSGGNTNSFSVVCELPPEADQYILFVGNFPGQTYEQTVASSPGTSPFTITVTNLNRNFGSIPPDPSFDHVQIFYRYNSSPNVLRDGGRTFSPDESVVEFEPELPAGNDTQVTVFVSSVNAAEDDFYPIEISPNATLTLTQENGPAMDWTATLLPGPTPSSVVAKFTRPKINGKRLFWIAAQLKDSSTGQWRALDANTGAAVTYYDGSAISHESLAGVKIKKDPGQPVGFGTAHVDDLMMLDVAGGSFDVDHCQWGTVEKFLDDLGAETTAANARYIALTGGLFRPATTQDLRMKIVKPPHTWDSEGYLGNLTNESINGGVFFEWVGDREGDEFILKPVEIGRDISSVDVRFWIENDYCRSGGGGSGIVSTNAVRVRAVRDDVIPGPVESLSVTGGGGWFTAKWADPLVGAASIDDVAIQYATDAAFTAIVGTDKGWGDVNTLKGLDPGKTYYWRLAAHNLSDQLSHPDTAFLGAEGWGPWAVFGSPSPVSSGEVGGAVDDVIPGPVVGLSVIGANGNYIVDWQDPTTGNLTIDDVAIQYTTDAGFTQNGPGSPAKGWGDVNHLQSTAPGQTYFFRVAVHNQSNLPSHVSTSSLLGSTGWGPWTNYGAPTSVPSGGTPNAPIDTVIPGPVQSLGMEGKNGVFKAWWLPPAIGNLTIDKYAEQYATDAAFADVVETVQLGDVLAARGTSPNKTYYFRFAAHNQSGLQSDSSTYNSLGPTGWGPWTNFGAPDPVSSRPIPLNPGQTDDGVSFNGNFETDADGDNFPDGWIPLEGTGVTAGLQTPGREGKYLFGINNNSTGYGGYGSPAFPVRAGEKLNVSTWALADNNNGLFIFRVLFGPTSNFQRTDPGVTYVDIVSDLPIATGGWMQYKGQVTAATGASGEGGFCRIGLYNWGAPPAGPCLMYFDDVQVIRNTSGGEIDDNTIPPGRFTGAARLEYIETFDTPLGIPPYILEGAGVLSYIVGGVDGGNVLQIEGSKGIHSNEIFIPFDPRKRYRCSVRGRLGVTSDPAKTKLYVGVKCFNAGKVHIGTIFCTANGFDTYPAWLPAEVWHELTGWFKGTGAPGSYVQPAPNPAIPSVLPTGTVWISPYFAANYPVEAAGNFFQIDDYRIEAVSESGEVVTDTLRDAIITTQKLVDAAITDVKIATSAITTTKIADDSVTTPKLVALNVTAAKIAALAITADKINVATLSAISANVGTVNAGIINCSSLIIRTGATNPRVEFDSTGFHSYDSNGNEYYKVAPQTIGTKVYGYEWRLHPNIATGASMVFGGHTDRASNILLQTADGSELTNRSAIYMKHGALGTGQIEYHTQHGLRCLMHEYGLTIADSNVPTSSGGVTLSSIGGYLGINFRNANIAAFAGSLTHRMIVYINGAYYWLPLQTYP